MGERTLVVDHLKLGYEGLFNAPELYNLIQSFFFEKGWDIKELINQEQITPRGKQVRIVLDPWKSVTEFYKIFLKIKIHMTDLKDVEVKHEGQELRLNQGIVRITFDGYVFSDRTTKWTEEPFYWFLTMLGKKYFFRNHFEKMETWLRNDLEDLHGRIKRHLNVFKHTYETVDV